MGRPSNPFSPSHWTPDTIRYRFEPGQSEAILGMFRNAHYSGWLCGPHGAGKSTLLAELERMFSGEGKSCRRVRATWARASHLRVLGTAIGIGSGEVLLLDSGECLPGWLLWAMGRWLSWRGVGLIATVHRLPRDRRALTFPTVWVEARPERLVAVLREETSGQPGTTIPTETELRELLQAHGGNAREVLADLYLRLERSDQ
jgi:hypothetical protein